MKTELERIILDLYDHGLIQFGNFVLSSGRKSSFYINLRVLPSFPDLFNRLMNHVIADLKSKLDFDTVCGIATGGIPFAAYIAFKLNKPLVYIRKEKKKHGSMDLLVGHIKSKPIIIDDVVTTGASLIYAMNVIGAEGYKPLFSYAIILRQNEVAEIIFRKYGVPIRFLLDAKTILDTLFEHKKIPSELYKKALSETSIHQ